MVTGTSMGGSVVVDSIKNDKAVIEEKVEDQDHKYEDLLKKIKELELEKKK
jgi:hypothetical protein